MNFGINTNLLETNVINLTVVVGCLIYFGGDILKQALNSRKDILIKSLETAQRQETETKQKLAALEEKKVTNQQDLELVIKPRLNRVFEENKKALIFKHSNEMQRLTATQIATLALKKERIMLLLSQQVKQRALKEGSRKITQSLSTNTNLIVCLVTESIPSIINS